MQKRALLTQELPAKTIFEPLPTSSDSAVYYDHEPISLSYSEHFAKLHFHNRYEIGFCEEGEGLLCSQGIFSPFTEGDLLFIPPHRSHYAHSLHPTQACRLRFYYILPQSLRPFLADADRIFLGANQIPSVLRPAEYPTAVATLGGILHTGTTFTSKETAILLRVATFLLEAEPMFGISQASLSPSIANHTGESTQLAEFLSVHYRENTSAAELAALFHLSESQMRRKFVKAYGRPPIAYRNSLRCKIADELLLHTNLSISEIAERIGYSTPADFYRSFLKIHGVTPSEHRRNHKKV